MESDCSQCTLHVLLSNKSEKLGSWFRGLAECLLNKLMLKSWLTCVALSI